MSTASHVTFTPSKSALCLLVHTVQQKSFYIKNIIFCKWLTSAEATMDTDVDT